MIVDDVHDDRPTFACALFCFQSLDQRIFVSINHARWLCRNFQNLTHFPPVSRAAGLDSDPRSQGREYPIGFCTLRATVYYLPSLIALRLLGVFGRGSFDRDALDLAHRKYRLSRLLQERAVSMASLPHLWLEMMSMGMKEDLEWIISATKQLQLQEVVV